LVSQLAFICLALELEVELTLKCSLELKHEPKMLGRGVHKQTARSRAVCAVPVAGEVEMTGNLLCAQQYAFVHELHFDKPFLHIQWLLQA
jgi:hypothetical protein